MSLIKIPLHCLLAIDRNFLQLSNSRRFRERNVSTSETRQALSEMDAIREYLMHDLAITVLNISLS